MARAFVILFVVLMAGVGFLLTSFIMDPGTPILAPLAGPLLDVVSPPTDAVTPGDTAREIFAVQPGSSAVQIAEQLKARNLIKSTAGFRQVVSNKGVGAQLAAGEYELWRGMSTDEIVETLARGQVRRGLIATIPEGWRAEQTADKLAAAGITGRDDFLAAVKNPSTVPSASVFGQVPPSLEGYLFPWTYEVRDPVTGAAAAELMTRTFNERVGDVLRKASVETRLSVHELITLASIVEREAVQERERPMIASVYLNRIKEDMLLQADPTVQYAVATRDGAAAAGYGYWKPLAVSELQLASPYNTYVNLGLPPGPICAPSESSIRAVAEPATTDYFYFVARDDGSHLFAKNLAEHNDNVEKSLTPVPRPSPSASPSASPSSVGR